MNHKKFTKKNSFTKKIPLKKKKNPKKVTLKTLPTKKITHLKNSPKISFKKFPLKKFTSNKFP